MGERRRLPRHRRGGSEKEERFDQAHGGADRIRARGGDEVSECHEAPELGPCRWSAEAPRLDEEVHRERRDDQRNSEHPGRVEKIALAGAAHDVPRAVAGAEGDDQCLGPGYRPVPVTSYPGREGREAGQHQETGAGVERRERDEGEGRREDDARDRVDPRERAQESQEHGGGQRRTPSCCPVAQRRHLDQSVSAPRSRRNRGA